MFLKPDYNLENIYKIDFEELKRAGIKAILLDLDSTIMASKSGVYTDETYSWLETAQENFFVAVVSNNKNPKYIEKVKKISNFPLLFDACKPRTGIVKNFLKEHDININDCVLVGDRPLTDILCGKLLGCKTILVDSITAKQEAKIVRFARFLERLTVKK